MGFQYFGADLENRAWQPSGSPRNTLWSVKRKPNPNQVTQNFRSRFGVLFFVKTSPASPYTSRRLNRAGRSPCTKCFASSRAAAASGRKTTE